MKDQNFSATIMVDQVPEAAFAYSAYFMGSVTRTFLSLLGRMQYGPEYLQSVRGDGSQAIP